jgi:hypothetical protein
MNALDPVSMVRGLSQSAAVLCFPPIGDMAASHGKASSAGTHIGGWPVMAGLGLIAVVAVVLAVSLRTGSKRNSRCPLSFPGGIRP